MRQRDRLAVAPVTGSSAALVRASHRTARHRHRHRRRSAAARPGVGTALLLYLIVAFAVTGGLSADPQHRMIAGNPNDVALASWFLRATPHALASGHGLLVNHLLNAPVGISMLWNTSLLVPGVLLAPLTLLAGPLFVYNLLTALGLALTAWTSFLLLRRFVDPGPAALGGLLAGFSPALLHASIGHLHLVLFALVPVLLSLLLDACLRVRPAWQTGLWLGLATAAQLLTGEEVFFDTVVLAAIGLVVLAASRPRTALRRAPHVAAVGGIALAVSGLLVGYPLAVQFFGPLHQHGSVFTPGFFTSDLTGFVTPSRLLLFHTDGSAAAAASYRGGAPEYLAYLGIPLLVVCAVVTVTRFADLRVRVAAITGTALAVLSLGGTLTVGGHDTGHWLPWALVASLPVFDADLPVRFALFVPLCAAMLLAVGVESARRTEVTRAGVLAAAVAVVALLPLVPRPLPTSPVPPVPAFFTGPAVLALVPTGSTALVLPFPTASRTAPMRWQVAAGMRFAMPGGFFIGPAGDGHGYVGGPGLRPTARLFDDVVTSGQLPPVTDAVRRQASEDLRYWHVRTVLLGPNPHRAQLQVLLAQLLGPPAGEVAGVQVWLLPPL